MNEIYVKVRMFLKSDKVSKPEHKDHSGVCDHFNITIVAILSTLVL